MTFYVILMTVLKPDSSEKALYELSYTVCIFRNKEYDIQIQIVMQKISSGKKFFS